VPFLHERLPNGLDVVAEVQDTAFSTSVGFFVATGARHEPAGAAGVSHFLEHMVFKGPPDLSAEEINRAFDALGASANAFTDVEDTVYHAAVLPRHQRESVELLARMMRPALRDDDFRTEKGVIVEEIRMYDDQPPYGADERCRADFFGPHPLGASVLGSVASIEALPVGTMRDYHRRRYAPEGMTLVASGAVDFPGLVAAARRWCGDWEPAGSPRPPADPVRETSPAPARSPSAGVTRIVRPSAVLDYAVRMTAGPDERDPDRWAAALLGVVLGDGTGSRLYWELVDPGLADHATCGHHEYHDAGLFVTHVSGEAGRADELLERALDVYRAARRDGITAAEFARARDKAATRVVLSGEKPRRRLFDVGLEWAHFRRYRSVQETLAAVEKVSLDDVHRVLAAWPLDTGAATVVAGPGNAAAAGGAGASATAVDGA